LKKAIREAYGEESEVCLFTTEPGTDGEGNPVENDQLYRRKIELHKMKKTEKTALKRQLQELLELLG